MLFNILSNTLYFTGGQAINISLPVEIHSGITVLSGPNGAGKSTFAHILEKGRNFRTNNIVSSTRKKPVVRCLEFNDVHSWTGMSVGYYQQRYEAGMNDEVPTVANVLGPLGSSLVFTRLCARLGLNEALNKKINFLSSGELRKLLVINALCDMPDLLIIDNPYIGLDSASKTALNEALKELKDQGQSIMLILSDIAEAPNFTDNFLYADSLTVSTTVPVGITTPRTYKPFPFESSGQSTDGEEIARMEKCKVSYGRTVILDNINWTIREGERWSLSGPNGSGKSTLLSLICADNPKSYSNNISIFGRRRGTGESIWDIKRHIGYVSPEIQLHFHGSGTVEHIVANGLNDTVGLYVKPTAEQLRKASMWLSHFGIGHLADRQFRTLSAGERQLSLIARSLIKEPRLLILDEPMHGLDTDNRVLVESTIHDFLENHPSATFVMVTHNPEELPSSITHHFKLSHHAPE